jgi:hypothetical protein
LRDPGFPHDSGLHLSGPGRRLAPVPGAIHNHGKFFVKRGEWVHDKSRDAEKIEAVFASLATL